MNSYQTPHPDHWFGSHDAIVTLAYWLAENGYDAKTVAHAVEKPWKYEGEFYAAKYDLDDSDLTQVMDDYNDSDCTTTIEEMMKLRAEAKASKGTFTNSWGLTWGLY